MLLNFDKLALWNDAFLKLKRIIFLFLVSVFIIGNVIDYLTIDESLSKEISIINGIFIIFSLALIILQQLNITSIKTVSFLAIYSIVISSTISLVFNLNQTDFEKLYLREMIIISILIIPAGFLLNKNHILAIGIIILMNFVFIAIRPENIFLRQSSLILLMSLFSFSGWIYYLFLVMEKWFLQQQILNAELEQQNCSLAKKSTELDKIYKTKDRLFSIIAHDLKNPFNSICGFSELLIRKDNTLTREKKQKYLKLINHSAEESVALLNNLLDWAITQTGDIHFNPTNLKIFGVVENVASYFKANSEEKEIALVIKVDKQAEIFADNNMLTTILRNLVSNALKYTPRKGSVNIIAENNLNETVFSIIDTGIGINETDKKNIFNSDKQVHTLGTEKEKGSGLGLVICKDFVNRHGGKLWLESEINKGATFVFSIPMHV